jgi:hypothetical protein
MVNPASASVLPDPRRYDATGYLAGSATSKPGAARGNLHHVVVSQTTTVVADRALVAVAAQVQSWRACLLGGAPVAEEARARVRRPTAADARLRIGWRRHRWSLAPVVSRSVCAEEGAAASAE